VLVASELRTEIEINAPAERVWSMLTDFGSFPEWNPFIRRLEGEAKQGAKLEVRLEPPGGRGMTFRPTIRRFEANREFAWLGRVVLPGVFDGEHVFAIEPVGSGKVRFVQRERFTGVLAPLILRMVGESTQRGFQEMNQALKERAEAAASAA
jgi:hypothetical protein